mmetsp:Transcript_32380/g.35889  ORF Transcript_32380/g.35889 Transcript_32380/m.35889 type:complete len:293 (+) Transcript_32380:54-932(+)
MNFTASNDIIETINAMIKQEKAAYRTQSGLYDKSTTTVEENSIDGECRRLMIQWFRQLAELCDFDHQTIAIAINILDRFVEKETQILPSQNAAQKFQLAAMASLYTSIKIHEDSALDPMTVSKLSKGQFSSHEIEEMESRILTKLDWRVNTPTAMAFSDMYLQLLLQSKKLASNMIIKRLVQCQVEQAMEDCQFLGIEASEIAFTATYNAVMITFGHCSCIKEIQQATNINSLPFQLEEMLMDHVRHSESGLVSSCSKTTARPTKKQQQSSGNLSPRSTLQHLSPRSITMGR